MSNVASDERRLDKRTQQRRLRQSLRFSNSGGIVLRISTDPCREVTRVPYEVEFDPTSCRQAILPCLRSNTNVYNLILLERPGPLNFQGDPTGHCHDPSGRDLSQAISNGFFFDSIECLRTLKTGTVVSAYECHSGRERTFQDRSGRAWTATRLHDSV